MKYLLDADIWSEMARAGRNSGVVRRFECNYSDFADFDGLRVENWFQQS
jgi:predicted nucleic acid-binding protein